MTKITGTSGDGEKILSNFSDFHYSLDAEKSHDNLFFFKVSFKNQFGFMNYEFENNTARQVNLDLDGFPKILGSHNDSTLLNLANKIHSTLE
ncbi:hypothetical protein MHH60_32555 [Paenibacillus sp. FSL H7-0716]|uniref:Uncharacterized protein n=1 Tax=Paenibacillus odorifer TaxID=189426 RepID=A0AB36J2H8_9BACL|nr:hypothetical protein [Paenibacillus odorifer]OME10015.1 hypothetical protein BSK47_31450 [Paenibacillus odorifer]